MATLEELLAAQFLQQKQTAEEQNPWSIASKAISGIDATKGYDPKDQWKAALLQNLASGFTGGLGQQQVESQFGNLASKLSKAYETQDIPGALRADPELSQFSGLANLIKDSRQSESMLALEKLRNAYHAPVQIIRGNEVVQVNPMTGEVIGGGPRFKKESNTNLYAVPEQSENVPTVKGDLPPIPSDLEPTDTGAGQDPSGGMAVNKLDKIRDLIPKKVPLKYQEEAIKETGVIQELDDAKEVVGGAYDTTAKIGTGDSYTPFTNTAAAFNAAKSNIETAVQSNWKGVMSEGDVKRMKGLLPDKYDTIERIGTKKTEMLRFLENNSKPVPFLKQFLGDVVRPIVSTPSYSPSNINIDVGAKPDEDTLKNLEMAMKAQGIQTMRHGSSVYQKVQGGWKKVQ